MPFTYSPKVFDACHQDFLSGLSPQQIATKHGIRQASTIRTWVKRHNWRDERAKIRQDATKRVSLALVDEKARCTAEATRVATALLEICKYYVSQVARVPDPTPEEPNRVRAVPLLSPIQLAQISAVLERAVAVQREALGMESGQGRPMIVELRYKSLREQFPRPPGNGDGQGTVRPAAAPGNGDGAGRLP